MKLEILPRPAATAQTAPPSAAPNWDLGGEDRLRYESKQGCAGSGPPRPPGGYGINSNYSNFVGTELAAPARYALQSNMKFEAGSGHFFGGD